MPKNVRVKRGFASVIVPPWVRLAERAPDGRRTPVVAGWMLVLAGAAALIGSIAGPVSATTGSPPWTYVPDARAGGAPAALLAVVVFGPLVGFNLIYWFARPRSRAPQLGWLAVLLSAELLLLTAAVIWVSGAGYPAGAVFDTGADSGDAVIGPTVLLTLGLVAVGIMRWLDTNTTFESQRAEYLHVGRTTVTATRLRHRSLLGLVLAPLAVWLLVLAPLLLSHGRNDSPSAVTNLPWPQAYHDGDELSATVTVYLPFLGACWGAWGSLLVQRVLYDGQWSGRATASSKRKPASAFARLLVKFRHWPFTLGGVLTGFVVPAVFGPDGISWLDLITGLIAVGACFGVGLLMLRWEWKARDLNRNTVRLQLAGSV